MILAAKLDFIENSTIISKTSSGKELIEICKKIIEISHNSFTDDFYINTDIVLKENYIFIKSQYKGIDAPMRSSIYIKFKEEKDLNSSLVITSDKLQGEYDKDSEFYKQITACINNSKNFNDLQNKIDKCIQLEKPKIDKKYEDALKAKSQESIDDMHLDLQKKMDALYRKGTGTDEYLKESKNFKIDDSNQKTLIKKA